MHIPNPSAWAPPVTQHRSILIEFVRRMLKTYGLSAISFAQ